MSKGRLEAFSDGVIAILITIMVLDLRPPHGMDPSSLQPVLSNLLGYVLSFVFLGIYWSNHHHLFQAVQKVNGVILWANLHLLFWLSLIPFVTSWMGNTGFTALPVSLYGVDLLFSALAYYLLDLTLLKYHGPHSALARAVGNQSKEKLSLFLYILAIPLSFVESWIAYGFYIVVAAMWLVPDRRIEKVLEDPKK
jgi:uncharacterized membrane protein